MLDFLFETSKKQNSVNEFCESIRQGIPSAVFGVSGAFKNYLVSNIDSKVVYVVKDSVVAESHVKQLMEFTHKKVIYIPPRDVNLVVIKAFSKDVVFERITALSSIEESDIIVVTPESLLQGTNNKFTSIVLKKGEDVDISLIVKSLVSLGYERVEMVTSKGTFSVRGDLLEVFPINSQNGYRLDFFGDNIESIKIFNPENRESLGFAEQIKVLQAVEFTFNCDDIEQIKQLFDSQIEKANKQAATRLVELKDQVVSAFMNNDLDTLSSLSYLSKENTCFLSLIDKETVFIFDEAKGVNEVLTFYEREFLDRFDSLINSGEVLSSARNSLYSIEYIMEGLKQYRMSAVQTLSTAIPFFNPLKIINPRVSGVANYHLDFSEVYSDISNWLVSGYSVIVFTGAVARSQTLNLDLSKNGIASTLVKPSRCAGVMISHKTISQGFVFHEEKIAIIGSGNLYLRESQAKRFKSKKQTFFTAPEAGDYCVHEVHGIGKVLGVKKISTLESTKDYIAILYAGGDVLYVPVEKMDFLSKYLGAEKTPKLSRIGGVDFERVKKTVRESIKKMSFDLKRLYSERKQTQGYMFESDSELEQAFANAFPFEETADQLVSEKEIKGDMVSPYVMDRLVCGDVGFGKTEVAFRAVFRAIINGKQAVMLAPTTILTEQHYNTAVNRFKDFGVTIACLNRFRSKAEQAKIIQDLKEGKIDFVIGTHRLLSKDIGFKDLGLLVLDEEQRFGVEHKERIKLLKKNVDTLTLTATPIPRTLHMSLSGIRAISTINTPPKKRLPVQTYVVEESEGLIRDAVIREVNRGGQVFILYNRVESIYTFAEKIRAILPNIKMTVIHGQMDEKMMENGISEFYNGQTSLLVSTTIIENGIDLPMANTIIVIDADRLGLSTLYQLKGRVGRSTRLAYAYFTFKKEKILTTTAYERLNAIIEFTEMGSGIKIAMRDLEIRGAGNILGAEQHGHMDKIGYELYSKLLREELTESYDIVPDLDINITAFIPESYMESASARMDSYKEIAEIKDEETEREFIQGVEGQYGTLPIEVKNLIDISMVKFLAMKIGVSKIIINKERTCLIFEDLSALKDGVVVNTVENSNIPCNINVVGKINVDFINNGENSQKMLSKVRLFLEKANKYKNFKS